MRSVMALRDMMLGWVDQEEQERNRFPHRDDNNKKRNGNSHSYQNKRNFDKKRKPEDTVATMDRGQLGKKGNQQDDFQKILAKPCPLHPKAKHTILECINLHKYLQEHQLGEEKKKKKDKQDEEDDEKKGKQVSNYPPTWSTLSTEEIQLSITTRFHP